MLTRLERIVDEKELRAEGQAGFRKGHRVEDNAVILKALVEVV